MTKRSFVFALGLVAVLTASQARAGSITTLYSTGVDRLGALLPAGALTATTLWPQEARMALRGLPLL